MWTIQKKVAGVGEVWYNNDIWFFVFDFSLAEMLDAFTMVAGYR